MRKAKQFCITAAMLAAVGMLAGVDARAELIPLAYYRLGEEDANSAPGMVAVETVDDIEFLGTQRNLFTTGGDNQPIYSDDTPLSPAFSSRSVIFDGVDDYFTGPAEAWHTFYPGFRVGMEAFVKIDELPEEGFVSVPFFDGGFGGGGGYGLLAGADGQWHSATDGFAGSHTAAGAIEVGVWTHIAFITGGSNFPFFLNGELTADTVSFYGTPGAETTIGANFGGDSPFKGKIDEARIFHWTGGFDPADLLFFQLQQPGDANGDGTTDLVDYDIWRMNVGKDLSGVGLLEGRSFGDVNFDGLIDTRDFDEIKSNLSPGVVIPEPSALALLGIGLVALLGRRGIRGRR